MMLAWMQANKSDVNLYSWDPISKLEYSKLRTRTSQLVPIGFGTTVVNIVVVDVMTDTSCEGRSINRNIKKYCRINKTSKSY